MGSTVYDKKMDNNLSDITTDYEKFYKMDRYGYTVHFSNKSKLHDDKIEEIFSVYGKVVGINAADNGFKFIKYKTEKEVQNCVKGLANSSVVQLLPEKSKVNSSNNRFDTRNSSQYQAARTENSKTFNMQKQFNQNPSYSGKLKIQENGNSSHDVKTFNMDNRFDNTSNFTDTGSSQWHAARMENSRKFSENRNSTYDVKTFTKDQSDNADNFSDTGSKSSIHSSKPNVKYDKLDSVVSNSTSLKQHQFNKSLNKIDYEKYYKLAKDGSYILHFANKKELDMPEIDKIFSNYGRILSRYPNHDSYNKNSNNNGLVFVRYKTLKETISCLEGLQNNDMINILPQKDKINDTKKKADQTDSNWQSARTQDSFQEANRQLNSSFNYDNKLSETCEENLIHNTTTHQEIFENTNNFLDIDSRSLNHQKPNVNGNIYSDSLTSNGQYSLPPVQKNSIKHEASDYNEKQQHKSNFHSLTNDTNAYMNEDTFNNEMPAISNAEVIHSAMTNSSSQSETKNIYSNVIIVPMQEIIVANIHANYDVNYILHLFRKYDPISAKFVETILEPNIRYCHVYFKTLQDAISIEEEFDNFNLSGKYLIVLRTSRLMKEGTYK